MTVKAQLLNMVEFVPEKELPIILEVVRHFVPSGIDDTASPDDIIAHKTAMQDYALGETISHNDIDWN
ncbi:MAG: phosphoribosylaminoimidazolesuccinocarboxamide synthase [Selenomonadaceae bacterium]|nr:phosphoribosylaminoimidazolesuccinocarboxamide synthase [Selenomonadaceae bacterium]MBP3722770.1 phosphoribosylaminoimidazolesuccinocarboxamide synthase [Selenomonadaceae bacterium]